MCRLDLGDGKKVDFEECPRSKLQKQIIKYLGPVCVESFVTYALHIVNLNVNH